MKPHQFILTQTHYFEDIEEDFQSDAELAQKYPELYRSIIQLAEHIGLDLSGWEISEGYIIDDSFEISYTLKKDGNIYFMISGDIARGKVLTMDFEMSRDLSNMFEVQLQLDEEEEQ